MQGVEYPDAFPTTKWTCLGTIYNKSVKYGYQMFVEDRLRHKDERTDSSVVQWEAMSNELFRLVNGTSDNWKNKPWVSCDNIYGIENIDNMHWVAYEYDFPNKEVKVYDSMSSIFYLKCTELLGMHAAILPSLYNVGDVKDEAKMDPDIPFKLTFIDVPQQPNNNDCGVYGCKFVQSLAMKTNLNALDASRFADFRRKLAIDLIRWSKTVDGVYKYTERAIGSRV